ncbi:MAG: hypothetical protein JWQ96_462 [Segetibacter sp.]|nr:hypothetical protein [Segetibacter sp.]
METMVRPPRTGMEAFELMPEGTLCQLINDTLVMSPASTPNHQRVLSLIYSRILNEVEAKNLGTVLFSPLDVYINDKNVFQPDLAFIATEREAIINWDKGVMGAPDLVIEILSKGNKKYDLNEKKQTYEQSGVKEYWVVDPKTKWCEGFVLQNNQFVSLGESTGVLHIKMFNLEIAF